MSHYPCFHFRYAYNCVRHKKENILHLDTPKKLNFLPNPINSNKDGEHNLEANSIEDF